MQSKPLVAGTENHEQQADQSAAENPPPPPVEVMWVDCWLGFHLSFDSKKWYRSYLYKYRETTNPENQNGNGW